MFLDYVVDMLWDERVSSVSDEVGTTLGKGRLTVTAELTSNANTNATIKWWLAHKLT